MGAGLTEDLEVLSVSVGFESLVFVRVQIFPKVELEFARGVSELRVENASPHNQFCLTNTRLLPYNVARDRGKPTTPAGKESLFSIPFAAKKNKASFGWKSIYLT